MSFRKIVVVLSACVTASLLLTVYTYVFAQQRPASSKVYPIITETIKQLQAEGITAKNAAQQNINQRYNTRVTQFDRQGRFALLLHMHAVTPGVLSDIERMGGKIITVLEEEKLVSVFLPIDKIDELASLNDVKLILPAMGPGVHEGLKTTEGDSLHNAKKVRDDLNVKGDNIRIGVISDGCQNWITAQATGDLPSGFDSTRYLYAGNLNKIGTGDEGTAMMEIIYDLAPNAELYFYGIAGIGSSSADMIDGIKKLVREKGCDIIVDDVYFYDQPIFEDETDSTAWTIARAARWAVDTGVVYISAAGNWAQGGQTNRAHYQSNYFDMNMIAAPTKPLGSPLFGPPMPLDLHDFSLGGVFDAGLEVVVDSGNPHPTLTVVLQWNDPWGLATQDYDLYLYSKNFGLQKASSIMMQGGNAGTPYEIIQYTNHYPYPDTVNIVINRFIPPVAPPMLLGMYIDNCKSVEYNTPQNSIWGQMGAKEVIAVGAVPWANINTNELFSSQGNYDVYFPNYVSRQKPDVVAVDRVAITGAGGFGSGPPGNRRFWGTSASAPHIAGLTAQLLSSSPQMPPLLVREKYYRTAIDKGTPGFDAIFGYGFVDIEKTILELDTSYADYGPDTVNCTTNEPMFFASSNGYAIGKITVTGGTSQPTSVIAKSIVSMANPSTCYCHPGYGKQADGPDRTIPVLRRWFRLNQTGGTNGQFDADITAYVSEAERNAAGFNAEDLRLIHWNGTYYDTIPKLESATQVGNTWKISGTFADADFSPFFVGVISRGIDVATIAGDSGFPGTTIPLDFQVKNSGNGWDTLTFRVRDTRSWSFSPADSGFALKAGDSVTVRVWATIPASDTAGVIDSFWLSATLVSEEAVTDSSLAVAVVVSPVFSIACSMDASWNMVSIPVTKEGKERMSIFPASTSVLFTYEHSYVQKDSLNYGVGYWLKFGSCVDIDFIGESRMEDTFHLVKRWNMIGSISYPVDVDSIVQTPADNVASNYWGYDGEYKLADTIYPGRAYWVKVKEEGKLFLKEMEFAFPKNRPSAISESFSKLNTLALTDGDGKTRTLYFGKRDVIGDMLDKAELPPLMPGIFDARFSSQNFIEGYSQGKNNYTVQIQANNYPLALKWNMVDKDIAVWITDNKGRNIPLHDMIITKPIESLSFGITTTGFDQVPEEFVLGQNYPNPFNPSTVIRYQLPVEQDGLLSYHVTLNVYNLLGQVVATLVDEPQAAGYYSVKFNAENLPSGIYFYKISSGMFGEIKKMLLLK